MLRAGNLDRRVELQEFTLSADGDPTSGTWALSVTVWAAKTDKVGVERFVTDAELAEIAAAYRIRYRSTVDPTWRVKDGSDLWDIEGVIEGPGRNEETILLVSKHTPGDTSG